MAQLPKRYVDFTKAYPAVARTYEALGTDCHGALLSLPTIGFPPAMASMSWIDDLLPAGKKSPRNKR